MKLFMFLLLAPMLSSFAQDTLDVIEVTAKDTLEDTRPHWREQDKTKILSGKKNRTSSIDYLPPVQTDNLRQHFSQQASIFTPEMSTEPWTSMSFRGIGNPHEAQDILLLQDGLPVGMDIYGSTGNYYSPPAPLMEELQVIAGGGALMYGPQVGGTINYLSPRLSRDMETSGRVNASYGSYNLLSTVNSLKGSAGKTSYYVGYYRKQGDGYQRDNADFIADHLQLKTHTYLDNNAIFKFSLQGYGSDFGMPGGMALTSGANINTWDEDSDNRKATKLHDRLRISRGQVMLGYEKKISDRTYIDTQIWASAYQRYSKTQNVTGNTFGTFSNVDSNAIRNTEVYGFNGEVRLNHNYDMAGKKNAVSVGYLSYNNNSPIVGQTGAGRDSNWGTTTSRTYGTTRTQSVFIENKFVFDRLTVVPGVRYENITLSIDDKKTDALRTDTYNVFLGGLGATYMLNENLQAFANASQGFKPVSYAQVVGVGNPLITVNGDIKPSYSYFYETGLRGESSLLNWDFSLYQIQRQNVIVLTATEISNGSSAKYHGVESSLTFKDVLSADNGHEVDLYLNGNLVNAKFHGGSTEGKTPAYVPSAIAKYGAVYRKQDKIKATLMGTFVNEHFADDTHTANRKIPSYSLYDFLFEYNFTKNWSANGAVNNILDRQYYSRILAGILPNMGRNAYLGASYRF